MKLNLHLLLLFLLFWVTANAQVTFPETKGVKHEPLSCYQLTNVTLHVSHEEVIEGASILIEEGKIKQYGKNLTKLKGCVVIDLKNYHIYPSFIDPFTDYGMPKPKAEDKIAEKQPQMLSNKTGAFAWNEAMKMEFDAAASFKKDDKRAEEYIKAGFGVVMGHRADGIHRGSASSVLLSDLREHELILNPKSAAVLSLSKGTSTQAYPSSLMGILALLKQSYLDAAWYAAGGYNEEYNISLDSWNKLASLTQIFAISDCLDALRIHQIAKEFKVSYVVKGKGDEYQRIQELKATGFSFILPLNFPKAYDVENPIDALNISLDQLKHWELAPANPKFLYDADISFSFTSDALNDKNEYLQNVRKAVLYGLPKSKALEAMTIHPARLLKIDHLVGSLHKGKLANFIVCNGELFNAETVILQNWIRGQLFELNKPNGLSLNGEYMLTYGNTSKKLFVNGNVDGFKMTINSTDSNSIKVKYKLQEESINLNFTSENNEFIRLYGTIDTVKNLWCGSGTTEKGEWITWEASRIQESLSAAKNSKPSAVASKELGDIIYPFLAYGNKVLPTAQNFVVRNATVWTNEKEGIMDNTDVLVENGKISLIGKNLKTKSDVIEIDGTGKHLTSGIIDEHSHIAIQRGVNEGSQECSAEVSIADVVNSEDINIYRQLSGGVTAAQLLHGSANPIGGQSGIIKLKWGYAPEQMKISYAKPFIKFALGENVKQSNWGDNYHTRFPQTRMGVEQVFEDYFTRALAYQAEKKSNPKSYRKDLELEVILQILNKDRFITCHSYVQSEILMLMRVAEKFNFNVNTFTHILEGYKIANEMKAHGVGASTFSDWWAYKFEVKDAIPYNAALLHNMGVVTAINSDDAEMGRRLNQEAGKAVMYGNLSQEDAWKLVSLNPAKLLRLDDKIGSIKKGKEADLVLWSDNPLSIRAKAEYTWIEGILFFSRTNDILKRKELENERNRLIQALLNAKSGGERTQAVSYEEEEHYHCDSVHDEAK